jgi:hypothetical protein
MKNRRRAAVAALSLAAGMSTQAPAANSFSNDVTDLWWNPNESGWGVNFVQQSNILFATLFVYDQGGQPHWYAASDMQAGNAPTDQPYVFSGPLYETTGPAFSAATFNTGAVTVRQVGSMSFQFVPGAMGTLSYTIDGTTVSKQVTRQTWRVNSLAGTYSGGRFAVNAPGSPSTCSIGTGLQEFDSITISHSGSSFSMTAVKGAAPPEELCRYAGTYAQSGHMGSVAGSFSCQTGASGTFTLNELEGGTNNFSGLYDATASGCRVYGNFFGIRTN